MNLYEYVNFYQELKKTNESFILFQNKFKENKIFIDEIENLEELFYTLNAQRLEDLKIKFKNLFNVTNFCYSNRWGSYDCTLCRMTFLNESQYNEHEKSSTHKNNLEQCANINDKIFNS